MFWFPLQILSEIYEKGNKQKICFDFLYKFCLKFYEKVNEQINMFWFSLQIMSEILWKR